MLERAIHLDPDACYQALIAHDARFDGAFFVGVKTTGVYCRPVCRARTPGRDRCLFFQRAAVAEQAGFRACFRCRPERAPGQSSVDAVSRLVGSAMRKIDEGALNESSVDDLATSLGVGSRHLRRVMQDELGVGPLELALSRRIAIARELLLGTSLPITEVAFASGFSSVRRFNAAYRAHQGMTPTDVRRPIDRAGSETRSVLRLVLDIRSPFDSDLAFSFLRARSVKGNEAFIGRAYLKAVALAGSNGEVRTGILTMAPAKGRDAIIVDASSALAPALMTIASRVRNLFDSDANLLQIAQHLSRDPILKSRVRARPALRVMGALDPFEWAIRAVLGQQVSVRAALTIASRLVERFGIPVASDLEGAPTHAWPDAQRLADVPNESLAALGLTKARAKTVHEISRAVAEGRVVLDRSADPETLMQALLAVPGVGPWTADYIAMRALAWPDAFPSGDLGLRKALGGISAKELEERAERWRPWRAYAAAHLWMGLSEETGT